MRIIGEKQKLDLTEVNIMGKKLYRSRNKKMVSGVCGGLEDYLGIDVTVIRLVWIVLSLLGGAGIGGIIVYIVAAIVIPEETAGDWEARNENNTWQNSNWKNDNSDNSSNNNAGNENWQRPNSNWQSGAQNWDSKDDTKSENNPAGGNSNNGDDINKG